MIPNVSILTEQITETTRPNRTNKLNVDKNRVDGYTDGLDAIAQAVQLILSTERYKHIIYSWDYGVELYDLIGKPVPYVISEIPRRVAEALAQDNRITDVSDFEFERFGKKLHVTFTVMTNLGNISTALEVEI